MSEQINEAYIGSGIVYVNGRDVGNCSDVNFSIDQETKTQRNFRGGGGNFASVTNITSVKLSMTMMNFSNANMALALRGVVDVVAAGTVTAEDVTAALGGLSATANMIDTAETVTVTNAAADVTYTKGTDYEVRPGGILVLSTGTITDEQALKVTYTRKAANVLQALVDS